MNLNTRLEEDIDSACRGRECNVLGAILTVIEVKPGSIVALRLDQKDSRWSMGRIHKLAAAVKARGAELVVTKGGSVIEIESK